MADESENKTETFYLRVEHSLKARFREAAASYPGEPSDVLRWLIERFCEGRLTVTPPNQPKE